MRFWTLSKSFAFHTCQVVADLDRHGQDNGPDVPRHWAWTLWHYNVHALPSPCEIVCKSCTLTTSP